MRASLLTTAAGALALCACAKDERPATDADPPSPQIEAAQAELRDAQGQVRARATAEEAGDSVRVRIEAVSLRQGAYGAHIHAVGRCDPAGFNSAGAHWNPTGHKHGKDNPAGMHKGDLPNLLVGTDGRGSFEYTIPNASLEGGQFGILDADGAAVVIHAAADDYRTDPSGNSGARTACGILG